MPVPGSGGTSDAEGLAAATGGSGVGVFHPEPRTHQAIVVAQDDAGEVEAALGIDEDAHAIRLDDLVHVPRPIGELEQVLEAGTPAALYGDAQPPIGCALGGEQSADLQCCFV